MAGLYRRGCMLTARDSISGRCALASPRVFAPQPDTHVRRDVSSAHSPSRQSRAAIECDERRASLGGRAARRHAGGVHRACSRGGARAAAPTVATAGAGGRPTGAGRGTLRGALRGRGR